MKRPGRLSLAPRQIKGARPGLIHARPGDLLSTPIEHDDGRTDADLGRLDCCCHDGCLGGVKLTWGTYIAVFSEDGEHCYCRLALNAA